MPDFIYADNAATSFPKPEPVYEFMSSFFRERAFSPGRASYDAALETEQLVYETRKLLTEFFGGNEVDRLTFCYNASDALNMLIFGLVNKGDHVVTSMLEHNSVLRPLHHRREAGEIEVTHVPADGHGYLDPDDVERAFRKNTRVVILNHVSNVTGTVQPITEVGRRCRKAGVLFVVDASQSAGTIPIDMSAMCIDALAFTGHKGLMGPSGIGGICSLTGVDIRPTRFGGTGINSMDRSHIDAFPYRLECGTLNVLGIAGLNAGVKWIQREGLERIHANEMQLWHLLKAGLEQLDGVVSYCTDWTGPRTAVLSMNLAGWLPADLGMVLDVDHGIAVRTGLQCAPLVHEQIGTIASKGTVRFSLGPFNTPKQVGTIVSALREVAS